MSRVTSVLSCTQCTCHVKLLQDSRSLIQKQRVMLPSYLTTQKSRPYKLATIELKTTHEKTANTETKPTSQRNENVQCYPETRMI